MNNVEFKINLLCKESEDKRNKAASSLRLTTIAYAILVIFVFTYTTIIYMKLKKAATPDNISAILKSSVESSLPELRKKILDEAKKNTPLLADRAVKAVHDAIPQVEGMIKNFIDDHTKVLIGELKTEVLPQFTKIIKENAPKINEYADTLTDDNGAKEIAKILVKEVEKEIDYNVIGDEFYVKLESLRKQLDEIATKPADKMTVKESTERKILVNWAYLINNGESLQSISETLVHRVDALWDYYIGNFLREADSLSVED